MLYESYYGIADLGSPFIEHHGIKGMKWGVRRYQNRDGSLTSEGRRRYRSDAKEAFNKAEEIVRKTSTNAVKKFETESLSVTEVKRRGNLSDAEAEKCISIASDIFRKAKSAEPAITRDLVTAANQYGCSMYGLEHRIKQPTSLSAKIGSDAKEKGISFTEAGKGIKDSIRYTVLSEKNNFVDSYQNIKASLVDKGYEETRCRNYFDMYHNGLAMHKSVQSVYRDRSGNTFEVQFQTPASQAAKELKIPIYEERRRIGNSESRNRELEQQMVDLAERVSDPPNYDRIRSH